MQANKGMVDKKTMSLLKMSPPKRPGTLSGTKSVSIGTPKTNFEKKSTPTASTSSSLKRESFAEEECKKPGTSSVKVRPAHKLNPHS